MKRFEETLGKLADGNNLRSIPEDGGSLIDLVSNDYLGLAAEAEGFHDEFFSRYPDAAFSSSASRLLSRRQKYHNLLETELGRLYRKEVLLFNSGYHANVGILSALGSASTLFLVDSMMHASGWDGLMLAQFHRKAEMTIFPHNDMEALERLIAEERKASQHRDIIIVTESIFSMDGDLAPLETLIDLKHQYSDVLLYLDEAHAFGVRGELGLGLAEERKLTDEIDILIGTFGKAANSMGAFIATSPLLKQFLLNRARSFIFSTALPPVNVAWSHFMLGKIAGMTARREHLLSLSRDFNALVRKLPGQENQSDSQIIPFFCGSSQKAIESARQLREIGYDVLPIRRPTVPPGSERIRLSLNSSLTFTQLLPLVNHLNLLL